MNKRILENICVLDFIKVFAVVLYNGSADIGAGVLK